MSSSYQTRSSATNPQFTSPSSPNYPGLGGSTPDSLHYNTFNESRGYQGTTTPSPGGRLPDSPGYPGQFNHLVQSPPSVHVTDYGSGYGLPDAILAPENQGYEEDFALPPTDFDALFSGKSRPSIAVTGIDSAQLPTGKANRVLGLNDPHNLVYENSGFSRTVHFDVDTLDDDAHKTLQAESIARKRRGFLPSFMTRDVTSESIAHPSKKSKSMFVSKNQMNKNDRWLEWSEKMRMEAQIKREEFVKKQEDAAKNKLPTPIRKARQESVKFVNRKFVPTEEETPLSKAISAMEQATPAKSSSTVLSKEQIRDRYSEDQWQRLHEYWGHPLFQMSRPVGYIIALVAMISAIPPILSTRWVTYSINIKVNFTYNQSDDINALEPYETYYYSPEYNCSTSNSNGTCYQTYERFSHYEHHGFWYNCTENLTTYTGVNDEACVPLDRTGVNEWQSAIIGLLLFSLTAGFLGSILTTCGVCANSLAKKVYYYHSAGEIYLVCGICSVAALVTYPAVLASAPPHEFGIGYFLGWVMPLCYLVSAVCMTLDDMIHSVTNDCCLICRRKRNRNQSLNSTQV